MHNLSLILSLSLSTEQIFRDRKSSKRRCALVNRRLSPTSFGWLSHLSFAHCLSVPTSVPHPLLCNGPQRNKKIKRKVKLFRCCLFCPRSLFIFNGQTGSNIQLSAIFNKIEWCCTIDATMRHNVASASWSQLRMAKMKRKKTKRNGKKPWNTSSPSILINFKLVHNSHDTAIHNTCAHTHPFTVYPHIHTAKIQKQSNYILYRRIPCFRCEMVTCISVERRNITISPISTKR